jgi:hypothetical protein
MKYADVLAKAGIPEDRRGVISDKLEPRFEVYAIECPPKPTDDLKRIAATAEKLHDLLESLDALWRISLGTIVDRKTGAWTDDGIDWRHSLEVLREQATTLSRDQEGKMPRPGRPTDTRLEALLLDIIFAWESVMPGIRGIQQNAHADARC